MGEATIAVTTHVARDLLQSAALFKHEHSVVWEYVSNGLEYNDPGVNPVVNVHIDVKAKRITVHDNGRGMNRDDLRRYFQMHGENIDRKKGKAGRGMFGTGKSAAFGIADVLKVTTVRNGKRSKVRLTRADIEAQAEGDRVPVRVLEDEVKTNEKNGTTVEVEGIQLKKIDVSTIVRHVERHIAHWPNATVFVNHHECRYIEPPIAEEHKFSTKGTPFESQLGNIELAIKVAKAPLEEELQGIAILSQGVWHETTLAGCERKSFANYLFGTIDVPGIATDKSPIPPFDMSRSMRLNPRNEVVAKTIAFIGMHLEAIRREIEKQDKERRKNEEARKLQSQADAIAELINQDFNQWRDQVRQAAARARGGRDQLPEGAPDLEQGADLVFGDEEPAEIVADIEGPGTGPGPGPSPGSGPGPAPGPNPGPGPGSGLAVENSPDAPSKKGKKTDPARAQSRRGGFQVEFMNMGNEEARAKYERDQRTIFVNLDHPQIKAALGSGGSDDPIFRRLAYEVAFSEYAIALASEMAAVSYYLDVSEPIVDIRETLNRLARRAATLYAAA